MIAAVPRSGSTLVCHLLNRYPDSVAVHEPFSLSGLRRWPGAPIRVEPTLLGIAAFFASARASLRERGLVVSKQWRGKVPDNPVGSGGARSGGPLARAWRRLRRGSDPRALRASRVVRGLVRVTKPLSGDFQLCVKHPSIGTALLQRLVEEYPCYATVRNPVAVLGSWNSVATAASEGHSRAAERLDPALRRDLRRCADRSRRQLHLLDWYFERIARCLPAERVIRYEEVVASGGGVLARIAGAPLAEPRALEERNASDDYDFRLVLRLGERLLASPGAWSVYYPVEAVEDLLAACEAGLRAQAAPGDSAALGSPGAPRDRLLPHGSA